MKRILAVATTVSAATIALVVALGMTGHGTKSAAAAPAARATANSVIDIRRTSLGRTLVDGRGRTLYLFEADRANVSNCSSSCLTIWPALTARVKPHARGGALRGKIGTIPAAGARRQVTYAGHPLYYYVGDGKAGDTNGQGLNQFGAKWYALSPAGRKIDND